MSCVTDAEAEEAADRHSIAVLWFFQTQNNALKSLLIQHQSFPTNGVTFHRNVGKPNAWLWIKIPNKPLTPARWPGAASSTALPHLCSSPAPPPRLAWRRSPSPAPLLSCPGTDTEIQKALQKSRNAY